jgi:predicted AAA+ superfamily ATPase
METLFERLIADFQERPLPKLTARDTRLPALKGKIDTLIGMRRTGKSWRLYQAMQERIDRGLPKQRLLYVNFDDERLQPLTAAELHRITDTWYSLYPDNKTQDCYLYFDEIQNVPGWEVFVRRLLDTEQIQITLTGSSARLLSREIATALRGRSLSTELFPFSFQEMLRHTRPDFASGEGPPGSHQRAILANALREYADAGGFPEVQGLPAHLRARILQEYVDVVILRDVVERHQVANVRALRYLIRHLLGTPGAAFSVNRFYQDLKSQGVAVGKNTLHEFLDYLEDAYLIQTLALDSRSERKRQVNPRKIYPIDPGLARAYRYAPNAQRGWQLETLVYLDLRRRGFEISYYRSEDGYEVDFFARSFDQPPQAIQVSADLADSRTREREVRALTAAMKERQIRDATIVTLDEEDQLETPIGPIRIQPAWRWLTRQ